MAEVSSTVDVPSPKSKDKIVLPPCKICGERSSGLHFGVNTCEACKAFFRRCLSRNESHKCKFHSNCDIVPGKRSCAACRFKKCLTAGMSKKAIKTGRHTYEKQTGDILELKQLHLQSKLKQDGSLAVSPDDRQKAMKELIDSLVQQYHDIATGSSTTISNINKFLEDSALQKQLFGDLKPLSKEEYDEVYRATGLDVDGRRELEAEMVADFEASVVSFICFAKIIPGFKKLELGDQIKIIRGTFLYYLVFMFYNYHHRDLPVMQCPLTQNGRVLPDEYAASMCKNSQSHAVIVSKMMEIYKLNLSLEEQVVTAALSVVTGESDISKESKAICSASEEFLLETLLFLIKKNHKTEEQTVAKIVSVITDLRSVGDTHIDTQKLILRNISDGVPIPQLLFEYVGLSPT